MRSIDILTGSCDTTIVSRANFQLRLYFYAVVISLACYAFLAFVYLALVDHF